MATYKGVKGVKVQSKASDPTASEAEGTVWYNTATSALKYSIAGSGAWASGPAVDQTRAFGIGSATQTASLYVGGSGGGATGNETESYNGTAWTVKNVLTQARNRLGSANNAPNTATIAFGGCSPSDPTTHYKNTETWDGTNWTEVADLNTARREFGGSAGTVSTAALGVSGYTTTYITNVEEWNGTSWAEVYDVNTGRGIGCGGGSTTDALFCGGNSTQIKNTETYNGTSWTEVADMNWRRAYFGGGITSSTSGIVFGGDATSPAIPAPQRVDHYTESWNGTSWTEEANLATPIEGGAGCGSTSAANSFGGYETPPGSYPTGTELWNYPVYTIKTVTAS